MPASASVPVPLCPRTPREDPQAGVLSAEVMMLVERKRELFRFLDEWSIRYDTLAMSYIGNVQPVSDTGAGDPSISPGRSPQPNGSMIAPQAADVRETSPRTDTPGTGLSSIMDSPDTATKLPKRGDRQDADSSDSSSEYAAGHNDFGAKAGQARQVGVDAHKITGIEDSDSEMGVLERKVREFDHVIERACSEVEPKVCEQLCAFLAKAEDHLWLHISSTLVILINTIVIAYTTNRMVEDILIKPDPLFVTVVASLELFFNLFYLCEVVLRLVVLRVDFVFGCDWNWNFFDLGLAASWLFQVILSSQGQTVTNNSYLRLLRLAKMMKLLRVIRLMRFFRELRIVLDSIMGSVKTMVWSVLLVLSLTFIFGTCFVNGAADFLREADDPRDESHAAIFEYWGTLDKAMLALFMASTGGTDWSDVAEPLAACGVQYYFIFLFYVAFFAFVMVNTLTSLFVEGVRRCSEKDDNEIINDELSRKDQYIKKIKSLYLHMDKGNKGFVCYDEFVQYLQDPRMEAFAASLEIDAPNLDQFFGILSVNGTKPVDVDTFVVGCIKLRGLAKSMDMMDVMLSVRNARHELHHLHKQCKRGFQQLRSDQRSARAPAMTAGPQSSENHAAPPSTSTLGPSQNQLPDAPPPAPPPPSRLMISDLVERSPRGNGHKVLDSL